MTGATDLDQAAQPDSPGIVRSSDQLGVFMGKRCTAREKCQGEDTRYDTVSSGVYSLTLKCCACGFIVRHDWD